MKIVVLARKCKGCGECLKVCPVSCMAMGEDNVAYCDAPDYCLLCGSCQEACPHQAILAR